MIKEIINRRSVRAYKPHPVSDPDITEIIKAAEFAPSGKHLKPVEYIVIKEKKCKEELFKILEQDFILNAPVLIVPVADTKKSALALEDICIASTHIFLQACALGLGTVWKHVSSEQKDQVKKILGVPEHFEITNVIPVGYPAEKPVPHTDGDFDLNKIHHEKF